MRTCSSAIYYKTKLWIGEHAIIMKGLFRSHTVRPLLLTAGTIVSALMLDYVFNITGNSKYTTKQLLIALGQPIPPTSHDVYSRYELADMAKRRKGGGARGGGKEEEHV